MIKNEKQPRAHDAPEAVKRRSPQPTDSSIGTGESEHHQRSDDQPRGVELTPPEAELRTTRERVMIVVEGFSTKKRSEETDVSRSVVEVLVPEPVAESIDRRRDYEDIQERVDARCYKPTLPPYEQTERHDTD